MRYDLEAMNEQEPVEWYFARGGHQYGPLTDPEMRKFIELGHLRTDDLVWHKGLADWTRADAVFGTTRVR
jgi:hypothetical protein